MSKLWIPPSRGGDWVCRVPTGTHSVCGTRFDSEGAMMRHVKRCVAENATAIHEAPLLARVPGLAPADPEIEAHMRQVAKRMLAEGRWEVKPSERAGFS